MTKCTPNSSISRLLFSPLTRQCWFEIPVLSQIKTDGWEQYRPKLYFVKMDVQACFDTIEQQKLLEILRALISQVRIPVPLPHMELDNQGHNNRMGTLSKDLVRLANPLTDPNACISKKPSRRVGVTAHRFKNCVVHRELRRSSSLSTTCTKSRDCSA